MEIAIILLIAASAVGAVIYPLITRSRVDAIVPFSEETLNEQVLRYREAIKGGTLCDRCLTANATDSRYCSECGKVLER